MCHLYLEVRIKVSASECCRICCNIILLWNIAAFLCAASSAGCSCIVQGFLICSFPLLVCFMYFSKFLVLTYRRQSSHHPRKRTLCRSTFARIFFFFWKHLWGINNFQEQVLTIKRCKFHCYFWRLCKWRGCTCQHFANRLFSLYLIFYLCTALGSRSGGRLGCTVLYHLAYEIKMAGCWMSTFLGIKIFVKVLLARS